jgi:glycerol-3-phosphate dehydrogenase (NAD(P)+)
MKKVSVIGAGAWGTTLSLLLAEKGHAVNLWVYEKELVDQMLKHRENKTFLPGFPLPENITVSCNLMEIETAELIFFAVPTQFLRTVLKRHKLNLKKDAIAISASKGIELKSLKLPLDIIKEELNIHHIAVLSGPNLSHEIASGNPAATVIASDHLEIARLVQEEMTLERFRVYVNSDILGVQLGGALKNVVAIAAGVAEGLELGNNALAGLIIRGIAEISRLGVAMGAQLKTFSGLSGMGDLIVTCTSKLSRNHCVGEQLARGKKLDQILTEMKEVAEGVSTTRAAMELADKYKVSMPLAREVYAALYEGKNPYQAITDLMHRTPTSE